MNNDTHNEPYHYQSCGLLGIYLRNGFTVTETAYGPAVSINNLEGLHRAIGLEIVCNQPELTGNEFRFLRKELDLSQNDLADLLSVSDSTLRNWERDRNKHISGPADRMLRSLYMESVDGESTVGNLLKRLSQLNQEIHDSRLEFVENSDGEWLAAA